MRGTLETSTVNKLPPFSVFYRGNPFQDSWARSQFHSLAEVHAFLELEKTQNKDYIF
jgi:hypothetical protein